MCVTIWRVVREPGEVCLEDQRKLYRISFFFPLAFSHSISPAHRRAIQKLRGRISQNVKGRSQRSVPRAVELKKSRRDKIKKNSFHKTWKRWGIGGEIWTIQAAETWTIAPCLQKDREFPGEKSPHFEQISSSVSLCSTLQVAGTCVACDITRSDQLTGTNKSTDSRLLPPPPPFFYFLFYPKTLRTSWSV